MKKLISAVCVSALLSGCAGMNSEFEHTTPAKDSGYWMQQADDMTSNSGKMGSSFSGGGAVDVNQYKLLNTGNLWLPLKVLNSNTPTFNNGSEGSNTANNQQVYIPNPYGNVPCTLKQCYPEPRNPLRQADSVSRLWLSPHISPDNNAHLGEIVYFITKQSKWAGVTE